MMPTALLDRGPSGPLGFFAPPDCRWHDRTPPPRRRSLRDPWDERVAAFRQGVTDPDLAAAHAIWLLVDEHVLTQKTLLEAYLLTPTQMPEVASRLGIPVEVVEAYVQVFFDVRGRLTSPDWITLRVLRGGGLTSFGGCVSTCLRAIGYMGGIQPAAVAWAVLKGHPMPTWVSDHEGLKMPELRKKVGLTIALMTARSDADAAAIIQQKAQERPPKTTPMSAEEKRSDIFLPFHERFLAEVVGKGTRASLKASTPINSQLKPKPTKRTTTSKSLLAEK